MAEAKPPRVLLVEDNEINQAVAIAILTRLGYHADVVGDGQEAVEQLGGWMRRAPRRWSANSWSAS